MQLHMMNMGLRQVDVNTLFGIKLAHILFGATEQVSLLLQRKDIAIQEALSGVDTAKAYFKRLHWEEEFEHFYDASVQVADSFQLASLSFQDEDVAPHDFKRELHLTSTLHRGITIVTCFLKHVIF